MFHATAMVRSYDAAMSRLQHLFGLQSLEYSEMRDPAIARNGGMTWLGDGSLELCEPNTVGAAPDRFVERTGGGMQGVALWVDDFAATVEHLERLGVAVPVQLDGFGFSSPRSTDGLQLEWSEFTIDQDPRVGAPAPVDHGAPLVAVTHLAFVAAVVDDPRATAQRFAELLGTRITFDDAHARPDAPAVGVDLGDCTLALHQLDPPSSVTTWGHRHDRPRVAAMGLRVAALDAARDALARASVALVHDGADRIVVAPEHTGDVEVVLVAELLPGDPRA